MSWIDRITQNPNPLMATFGPQTPETVTAHRQSILSTYQGPGREKVLGWLEQRGKVPGGVTDMARQGVAPTEIGNAVHTAWQQQLAGSYREGGVGVAAQRSWQGIARQPMLQDGIEYAADGAQALTTTTTNPVFGGLMGQRYAAMGYAPFVEPGAQRAAGVAADVAPQVSEVAGEVASESPELRTFVDQALAYIGTAALEQRSAVLADTISAMTKAGASDGIDAILAREIAASPVEHAAPALLSALEKADDPIVAAAHVAESAAHAPAAAHAVEEAVTGIAHTAPEAARVAAEVSHELHPSTIAAFTDALSGALKVMHRL